MRGWSLELAVGILLICAYEVRAHIGDDYRTLTALIGAASAFNIGVVFMFGFVMGHLFWPR